MVSLVGYNGIESKKKQEIEGAYFMIDTEKELISTMLDTVEWGVEPKEGWEKFALNLAEISCEKYKMQIQE